ncbi:hypothetical protein WJX84_002033 [Apatococcus fuscideae]|uniref:PHD-type domain-containing protein n=1 Tax=Apatococcus fuscideae TaxID=2026836 RepID=A0AAW1RTC9_9CHLO
MPSWDRTPLPPPLLWPAGTFQPILPPIASASKPQTKATPQELHAQASLENGDGQPALPPSSTAGLPPAAVGAAAQGPQLLDCMELDPGTGAVQSPAVEPGRIRGQAALLRDVHACLLRLLEGHEEDLLELATLPGYGAAADLAPSEAYRPLLGLSWPALVQNALLLHSSSVTQPTAIQALAQLKVASYEQLGGRQRLAILEALLGIVADTEAVRNHMLAAATAAQEQNQAAQGGPHKHMGLLGSDASGARYHLLAGDTDPGDGYRAARGPVDGAPQLRQELLDRLNATRWWDKPSDWLQARAAVERLVRAAETGPQLGRLMWLVEELTYDDLLKGTGWGRRRSAFREQLEQCRNLHQAAVLCGQLAIHCRSAHEMGHISQDDHVALARQLSCPLPPIPSIGQAVYVLQTAYEDHLRNTGLPDDPAPPRPPAQWGRLMRCIVAQVGYLRTAHPPRLSATGRFLPNMQSLASHADEGKRLLSGQAASEGYPYSAAEVTAEAGNPPPIREGPLVEGGSAVKMPADGAAVVRALSNPQAVHWYTGILQNNFPPSNAAGMGRGREAPDPCRALRIAWDDDTPALVARQPAFHPWQVAIDEGGLLRGHKQRLKAEALARCQAEVRARNDAAVKRAAEREAALDRARIASQARVQAARQQQQQQQQQSRAGSQPGALQPPAGLSHSAQSGLPASVGSFQQLHHPQGQLPGQQQQSQQPSPSLRGSSPHQPLGAFQPAGQQGMAQQPSGPGPDARPSGAQVGIAPGPSRPLPPTAQGMQAMPGSFAALLADQDPLPSMSAQQQPAAGWANGDDASKKAGGRPRKRKGRDDEGGEADEPGSGRVRKAQKGPSEGYRDRWIARKPRPNPTTWCSAACSACEQGGPGLLVCMGPCLRAFHMSCLGLAAPPADPWFCPECQTGRVRCFVCKEFSTGMDDPHVRKCSLGVCGRFYHMQCVERLELTQMAKKGMHFRCPQHYCANCRKSGDGIDMVKCLRCPTAYHSSCMPKHLQRLVPPHKVILCDKHAAESAPPGYAYPPAPSLDSLQQSTSGALKLGTGSHKKPRDPAIVHFVLVMGYYVELG